MITLSPTGDRPVGQPASDGGAFGEQADLPASARRPALRDHAHQHQPTLRVRPDDNALRMDPGRSAGCSRPPDGAPPSPEGKPVVLVSHALAWGSPLTGTKPR